ncbi:Na/Pi-cotransporter [Pasteurella testudinis DSM 23072]|uniref:Na/Pi-cotransporter n=1 Tax=Pasteurella testudinis DSM 23072 TaxID=1122938 RepID=A0A1W1UU02_9PAST|nr:Na/Pi symporter [Pasteurella testudinis]SMB84615.1 Na/Pi-cotransporter [Pasteurella testudinis DSM 23072]SUB52933.1 Na/Pi-cotransporter II-related protein [Pasteurella testudinis]
MNKNIKSLLIGLLLIVLAYSFWYSAPWLQLCYGLALFLFGMQCIEEGLHHAAGGTLERMMAKSTATPGKGLLFGMGATFILQSSTLVSLLTIAFLSTGLIGLAGGIAVILGTNLGATSGIWLLALAGQSISLSPAAVPMLVFGILLGFFKAKAKPIGRVLLGIALIFIGIDAIKNGFQDIGSQVEFTGMQVSGMTEIALFSGIGLLLTIVLQSSHATLILTLAALAGGQISLAQAFAIAVGSNVGSSVSTAVVGMLGSERSGQRLALAHLLFNVVTAVLSLLLWLPLTRLVMWLAAWAEMNPLLQLALFHTLFNLLGLVLFWKLQSRLAAQLLSWLPEKSEEGNLLPDDRQQLQLRYLNDNVLRAGDTAMRALFQ